MKQMISRWNANDYPRIQCGQTRLLIWKGQKNVQVPLTYATNGLNLSLNYYKVILFVIQKWTLKCSNRTLNSNFVFENPL
jgi:hypothetical protein